MGASVVATDVDERHLHGIAGCEVQRLDVTDGVTCRRRDRRRGVGPHRSPLFNAAGFVHRRNGAPAQQRGRLGLLWPDLNVRSMYRTIRAALLACSSAAAAWIITAASVASSLRQGHAGAFAAMAATKAAVIGLTMLVVAADYITRGGIRCNAIQCPGTVESPACASASASPRQAHGPPRKTTEAEVRVLLHRPPADGAAGDAH